MSKLLKSSESSDEFIENNTNNIVVNNDEFDEFDEDSIKVPAKGGRNYQRNFKGTGKEDVGGYKLKDLKIICKENFIRRSYHGVIFKSKMLYYILVHNKIIEGTLPRIDESELNLLLKLKLLHGPLQVQK